MPKPTPRTTTATEEKPPEIDDAETMRAVRIQHEAVKAKERVWEAKKEDAKEAGHDFEAAVMKMRGMIDGSAQGELFRGANGTHE